MVVGISQTDQVDPLDEDWSCELGGFLPQTRNLICSGFVWENGVMTRPATLSERAVRDCTMAPLPFVPEVSTPCQCATIH